MDYKYDVVNYNKNIPATIMHLHLSSDTHKTELQWHREPEIVYVVEGRSECSRNGESQIVEQGDFIIFNSEDVHLVRPVDGTGCHLLCVNFSFEYIRMFCKSIDSLFFDVSEQPELKKEIIGVLTSIAEVDNDSDYAPLIQIAYINKLYYMLLTQCVRFRRTSGAGTNSKRDFSYAKTAIAYINENFKREIFQNILRTSHRSAFRNILPTSVWKMPSTTCSTTTQRYQPPPLKTALPTSSRSSPNAKRSTAAPPPNTRKSS